MSLQATQRSRGPNPKNIVDVVLRIAPDRGERRGACGRSGPSKRPLLLPQPDEINEIQNSGNSGDISDKIVTLSAEDPHRDCPARSNTRFFTPWSPALVYANGFTLRTIIANQIWQLRIR